MRPDQWNNTHFVRRPYLGKMVVGFTGFILALSLAAGSAWSLDEADGQAEPVSQVSLIDWDKDPASVRTLVPEAGKEGPAPLKYKRNSSLDGVKAGTSCPSLLKTVRHTPLNPSVDDGSRPNAEAAAVLGYALGLRYALTPPASAALSKARSNGACT